MTYLITYMAEDREKEEVLEVSAYSKEQAYFLARSFLSDDSFIIGIELVCQKACGI